MANEHGRFELGLSTVAKRPYLSPLRYPGGKRKLVAQIGRMLDNAGVKRLGRILEPFVGGGAVSIAFLEAGLAEEAVLNDIDPLVATFWHVVFSDKAFDLVDRIYDTPASLEKWHEVKGSEYESQIDIAFKCLFLNRTSFSGALHNAAGPIGGQSQASQYDIGCRYNQEALAERIFRLQKFSGRVRVRNVDFRRFMGYFRSGRSRKTKIDFDDFWYLDPPFFHKADKLYRFWFESQDHKRLAETLKNLEGRWLLSYDQCPEARQMYSAHPGRTAVDMRYSAAGAGVVQRMDTSEMIVSNLFSPSLPAVTSPRQMTVGKL